MVQTTIVSAKPPISVAHGQPFARGIVHAVAGVPQ